jgi:hypothetical protein
LSRCQGSYLVVPQDNDCRVAVLTEGRSQRTSESYYNVVARFNPFDAKWFTARACLVTRYVTLIAAGHSNAYFHLTLKAPSNYKHLPHGPAAYCNNVRCGSMLSHLIESCRGIRCANPCLVSPPLRIVNRAWIVSSVLYSQFLILRSTNSLLFTRGNL